MRQRISSRDGLKGRNIFWYDPVMGEIQQSNSGVNDSDVMKNCQYALGEEALNVVVPLFSHLHRGDVLSNL